MGVSIRQVKERQGDWYCFVRAHGQRTAYRIGQDKREAEQFAAQMRRQVAQGKPITTKPRKSGDRILLTTYFEQWLRGYAKVHCKKSTYHGYTTAWTRYLKPALGNKALSEIDRQDVRVLAEQMYLKKSRAYVKATFAPLSAVLNRAIEDGLLTHNPALRVLPKQRGEKERQVRALTKPELSRLLAVGREGWPSFFPFIFLIAMTGLRIGEAVALRPQDLYLDQGFMIVSQNFVDGELTTPKSRKSRRVDLGSVLVSVLTAHLALLPVTTPYLFLSPRGKMINPDNWRKRQWKKIVERAELPTLNIKDLRHTFASLLIQQGAPLAFIKEQMGHHSIMLTVDTYGHLVPGANRGEMEKLSEGLLPRLPLFAKSGHFGADFEGIGTGENEENQ